MTLTLRRRLLLTQLPFAVLFVVLGYGGSAVLGALSGRIDAILRENYDSVVAMEHLNDALERIDSSFQFALAGREDAARAQYEDHWRSYRDNLVVEQGNVTLPGEAEAVERLGALTDRYRADGDQFYADAEGPASLAQRYFAPSGLLDEFKQIKDASTAILRMNERSMEQASRDAKATASRSRTALAVMLLGTLIVAAFAAYRTIRGMLAPIVALTKSATAISAGDLDQTVPCSSGDEIAILARAFNAMARRLKASRDDLERRRVELVRANRDLAEQARERERAERKYRSIFENAVVGIFQTTPEGRYLDVNAAMAHVLGYSSAKELASEVHDIGRQIYVDPARRIELLRLLQRDGAASGFEAEYIRKDKTTLWFSLSARAVRDEAGWVAFYEGFAVDVTERKRAEEQVARLARLHAVAADVARRGLRLESALALEDEAVRLLASALDVDFCNVMELMPGGESFLLRAGVGWGEGRVGKVTVPSRGSQPGHTVRSKEPVVVTVVAEETRFVPIAAHLGEIVESSMSVVIPTSEGPYGALGAHTRTRRAFTKDEIDFLQTMASVLGAAIDRHRLDDRLRRVNRAFRALSSCNALLIRAEDEPAWLRQLCQVIVEHAGYRMCWVGYAEHDEGKRVRPVAQAGFDEGYIEAVNVTWADTERGRGPTGSSIRNKAISASRNIATDPRLLPWREDALKRGFASSIALPLIVESEAIGALTIYAAEADAFGEEEVRLLAELAGDLAYGITTLRTRSERAQAQKDLRALNADLERRVVARTQDLAAARGREVETGLKIQKMLLLDQPPRDVPGLRIGALTIPSSEIGGDFYGFLHHENHCLDLFVADVMGKGIPAALLSAAAKSHFPAALWRLMSTAGPSELPQPKDLVTLAHANMARELIELESFVTLCYARIDRRARRLDFVDCGHTGVLHAEARTGRCSVVHGENVPLGVIEGEIFDQVSIPFDTDDLFLFYSDGVTEARDEHGELFGADRLVECVRRNAALEPAELIQAVRDAVSAFSGPRPPFDDLTCVAVRVVAYEPPLAYGEVELASDLTELRRARDFVRGFCAEPSRPLLEADELAALELAVDEAVANIVKHAYGGRSDQRIHVSAEAFSGHVSVRLRHMGKPFDASTVAPPSLDGSRESGFGVYLIERSVDGVHYRRDEIGRNCIDLEKRRRAAKEA